jgi:uncharacterized FlaG/YvyC family protein
MEVSSKIRPVDAYNQKIISTAVASKPRGRPSLPINSDLQGIEQTRQAKADAAQRIADGIKNFLVLNDVRLEFSIDKDTGGITVRIINNPSNRLIREIPGGVILGGIGTIDKTV